MRFLDKVKEFFIGESRDWDDKDEKREKVHEKININDVERLLKKEKENVERLLLDNKKKLHGELSSLLEKLEEDMGILSGVDLDEKKGDDRLKRFNELGRKDYLESLERFVEILKDGKNDVVKIDEGLKKFVSSSNKSFSRVTLLIGKEMESIIKDIGGIGKIVGKYGEENSKLIADDERVDELLKKYDEKVSVQGMTEEINGEIEKGNKDLDSLEEKLGEINQKIKDVKNGDGYTRIMELEEKLRDKGSIVKGIKSKLDLLLDRRVLEKFIYLDKDSSDSELVRGYLDDSVRSVIDDEELRILSILGRVIDKVREGTINVKYSDKIIGKISISREVFEGHRKDILRLNNEVKEIDEEIGKLNVYRLELGELEKDKFVVEGKTNESKNESELLKIKLGKIESRVEELVEELVSITF